MRDHDQEHEGHEHGPDGACDGLHDQSVMGYMMGLKLHQADLFSQYAAVLARLDAYQETVGKYLGTDEEDMERAVGAINAITEVVSKFQPSEDTIVDGSIDTVLLGRDALPDLVDALDADQKATLVQAAFMGMVCLRIEFFLKQEEEIKDAITGHQHQIDNLVAGDRTEYEAWVARHREEARVRAEHPTEAEDAGWAFSGNYDPHDTGAGEGAVPSD